MKIYAARDKDGRLWLYYGSKPQKLTTFWTALGGDFCETSENLPSVKWEDEEPTEVEWRKNDKNGMTLTPIK